MEEDRWDLLFDCNFPARPPKRSCWRRNLIPLEGSNTLLIIDNAAIWSIYDLSSRKVVGDVLVRGLKKDQQVLGVCCRRCSDGGKFAEQTGERIAEVATHGGFEDRKKMKKMKL
ncbi:hypothetical protein CDL15_Pgr018769 [Punica granatum]|nr:hypothetical protein CDL15_Pgr018769 [Punica granatum]